jgi:hypothetical protein
MKPMPVNPYTTSTNPYASAPAAAPAPAPAAPPPPPGATSVNPYAKQDSFTRSAANTTAKPAPTTATNPYASKPANTKPAAPATTSSNPYASKPANTQPAAPATTSSNPYATKPATPPAPPATTTTNPYGPKPTPVVIPVKPVVKPAPQGQTNEPFWPFATPIVPLGVGLTLPANTAPSEIADAFQAALKRVPAVMGRAYGADQIYQVQLDLARQAVNQLVNANGTVIDKVHALNDIGDAGVLTTSQKLAVQDELCRRELARIRHSQDSFDEKRERLSHMDAFMPAGMPQTALQQLVDDEARRIAAGHDSPKAREGRLAKLRTETGMSFTDFEAYRALIH